EGPVVLLVADLRRAVEQVVVERMALVGRQVEAFAVDRGGRRGDELLDPRLDTGLEQVEGAGDVHLEREAWLHLAEAQPGGRLVKDVVDAAEGLPKGLSIPDVRLDDLDLPVRASPIQMLRLPPDHAV